MLHKFSNSDIIKILTFKVVIIIKRINSILRISVIAVCLFSFFMITADSIFTVHDDILTYMQVQQGDLWQTALNDAKHGRIGHIPLTWLLYIPYFFKSTLAVRSFSMAAVIFDMTALYCLIKNNIDKNAAWLSCLLFISFACISNQHNLFVSYILGHQIPSGMILFSLNEFTKYYSSRHKASTLVKSALLLFTASFLYEACAAYIIIFVLIAMYKNKGNIFKNCARILYDTHYHILFLLLFTIIYMLWRRAYPSDYDGAKLFFGNIPQSLVTMFRYSFGMTPCLPAAAMIIKKYITAKEFHSSVSIFMIISPVISAAAFFFIFPKIKECKNKGALALLCTAGIITPNLIISFTPKYSEWTSQNSYSYVTSFYSYFFLIPLFLIILKSFIRTDSKPVMITVSLIVFAVSLISNLNNAAWNKYFAINLARYEAFSAAVSDDFFDTLENGTIVYIPDYSGIHNDMDVTRSFAAVYTDSDITFTNNPDDIDFSYPVVFLKYNSEDNTMIAGSLLPDLTGFNAFYIYGKENLPVSETIVL